MTAEPIARPGDPDLDADVSGLVITSVVSHAEAREVLIRATGGRGRWVEATGEMVDVDRVTDLDLSARVPSMTDEVWSEYLVVLHRWRDEKTPLRMCSAPGRVTLLFDAAGTPLPFPRRPDPLAEEGR